MSIQKLTRRYLFKEATAALVAISLAGCTKSVTKYRADGTPYTEEEEDWIGTLAAFLLFCICLGIMAANKEDDKSSMNLEKGANEDGFEFASLNSMNGFNTRLVLTEVNDLKVDPEVYREIRRHNIDTISEQLLAKNIRHLLNPVEVRLSQGKDCMFDIDSLDVSDKKPESEYQTIYHNVLGNEYCIQVKKTGQETSIVVQDMLKVKKKKTGAFFAA